MTATWKIWNTFSPCNFQNWNDFPSLSTTMIAQLKWKIISLVWIFPEQFITRTVLFFKNPAAKSPLLCLFTSVSERSLTPAPSKFTQENWFWKWIWKTMGEVDLDFKWAISPRKSVFPIKIAYPQSVFKSSVSLLYAYSESWIEVCPSFFFGQRQGDCDFQFKSDHMKGKNIWKIQFAKAITACIFASARRWKEIISECPPRFAMSLCSQASLLSWMSLLRFFDVKMLK